MNHINKIIGNFSTRYHNITSLASSDTTFYANQLQKQLRKDLLPLPEFNEETLIFGKHHSDHILTIPYTLNGGWQIPVISAFKYLQIHPFNSSLHYAIQCFEGLKAYRNTQGQIRLFRPECNALRFKSSCQRLTLPDFDGGELIKCIAQFLKIEERWIPAKREFSLYVRPLHISMEQTLGVKSPDRSQIMVMAGPVGPYYPTGTKAVSLYCATQSIRSSHKGTGAFKIGGNYAPTLLVGRQVAAKGHQQALWLLGDQIIEVGASNIFFIFKDKSGDIEITTPELEDLILPGVTRDSILQLLRDEGEYKVSERRITITQVIDRLKIGELIECFGAGTAVIVSGVRNIEYKEVNYAIPIDEKLNIGKISHKIRQKILGIQEGRLQDKFGWIHRVK